MMKIVIICVFGIESATSFELKRLGYRNLEVSNGRIAFEGTYDDAARCNLWLRTAERVYIEVGSFRAYDFDSLYEGIRELPWKDVMPADASFPVRASSIDSKLFSTRDCQSVGKKAIADSLSEGYGKQWMSEEGLNYPVEIFIHKDNATINLDTTGTGLHKRGYRTWNVEAPLKETIAAGLLAISYWNPGKVLLDPFCGSGTFPIEAAMDAMNIAPGMKRSFNIEDWGVSDMKSLREEAASGIRKPEKHIYAGDISSKNIDIAIKHAKKAGVREYIDFRVSDFRKLEKPADSGVIIANPPYGKRISDKNEISDLYKGIGEMIERFGTWSAYILTDEDSFETIIRKKADKRRKIYNGTIRCTYYQYFGTRRIKG